MTVDSLKLKQYGNNHGHAYEAQINSKRPFYILYGDATSLLILEVKIAAHKWMD